MRILHLADVHFHEQTLDDLAAPCRAIVHKAQWSNIDRIVIAGDLTTERGLIDNATAVAVRSFVAQLAAIAPVDILAGNHDLTYRTGVPNNIRAILAHDGGPALGNVQIIDEPMTLDLSVTEHKVPCVLAYLPYPSHAMLHARMDDDSTMAEALEAVVRGFLAKDTVRRAETRLLVYHGTVEGGRLGDESVPRFRTRGEDVVLPLRSLDGFHGVLAGHLHHPQEIDYTTGQVVYPGCVAPLTFGERTISPGVEIWTVEDGRIARERQTLPVTHQRLQIEVGPEDWDEDADAALNLMEWLVALDPPKQARVKIKATLPRPRLELLTQQLIEDANERHFLDKLVVEKIEHEPAKMRLDVTADRAATVDVVESLRTFDEYIQDPAYSAHIEDIMAVGREVEECVERDLADPRYSFEPLRLQLTNYKQFADVVVDFTDLPARSGVLGPTGIGKSNLVLALEAALYGGNPKSETGKAKASIAEMVRRGESEAMLQLTFRAESGQYRITRKYRLDGNGRGASVLYFEQRVGDGWEPANAGTSKDTQKDIERVVGPKALHELTRHLKQHGTSAVKMTTSDLADAINATLQLDFEAREAIAKAKRAEAVSVRDRAQATAETIRERLVPVETIAKQESHVRELMRVAQENGRQDADAIERLEADREGSRNRQAQLTSRLEHVRERLERREHLEGQLGRARAEADKLDRELAALAPAPDVVALQGAADQARDRAHQAQEELQRLKDSAAEADLEDAHTLGGLEQSRAAAAGKRQDAYRRHEAARRELERAAKSVAKLDRVPCRGEVWLSDVKGEMDGGVCELLADAREARDQLPTLTEVVQNAHRTLQAADADYDAAHRAQQSYVADAARHRAEREDRVRAAAADAATALDAQREAERRLQDAREQVAIRGAITARLAPVHERIRLHQAELDAIPLNGGHVNELQNELASVKAHVEQVEQQLRQRRENVQKYRDQVTRCEADLEQLDLERVQHDQMLKEIARAEADVEASERRRVALDYYRQAVQRTGIPSLLLEQLVPQLESRVNDILEPVGRAIRIDTERVTTTGKTRTEVTLSFRSPSTGDGFVPIAELSGGEEDLANLAFSAGLARVAADMSGTELGTVVLDEPCAGVSESLQSETLEVLGRIGQHVQRSVIVTHRRDLAAACDAILEVSANGAGSVVEVVR